MPCGAPIGVNRGERRRAELAHTGGEGGACAAVADSGVGRGGTGFLGDRLGHRTSSPPAASPPASTPAGVLFATGVLATGFRAAGFFATGALATGFLSRRRLGDRLPSRRLLRHRRLGHRLPLAAGFSATGFATGFSAAGFFATGVLLATGFFATGFLATGFFAAGFLTGRACAPDLGALTEAERGALLPVTPETSSSVLSFRSPGSEFTLSTWSRIPRSGWGARID